MEAGLSNTKTDKSVQYDVNIILVKFKLKTLCTPLCVTAGEGALKVGGQINYSSFING